MQIQFKKNTMGVMLLGKVKIYEIAKKLGLASKEVLEMAQKLNIEVKSHMSGVEEEEARKIENSLSKKSDSKPEMTSKKDVKQNVSVPKKDVKPSNTSKKEEKAPVIIRREVIIND